MDHRTVSIKHSCGYAEPAHKVEIGAHTRNADVSVEDHLRVKPCIKCGTHRGGWAWEQAAPLSESVPAKNADPKPKAGKDADPKP